MEDLVDELDAEDTNLSRRAARYIRLKRREIAGLRGYEAAQVPVQMNQPARLGEGFAFAAWQQYGPGRSHHGRACSACRHLWYGMNP